MNDTDFENELAAYGIEECPCDPLAIDANDSPCTVCGERVKHMDHVHYKGQLFHLYCLLLAVLRELKDTLVREKLILLDCLLEERAGCQYDQLTDERIWKLVFEASFRLKKDEITLGRLEFHAREDDLLKGLIKTCKAEAQRSLELSRDVEILDKLNAERGQTCK